MAVNMCRSTMFGNLLRNCTAVTRRSLTPCFLQNKVKPCLARCIKFESGPDSTTRNPSDFQKIEYTVPKDVVGRVLGREKQVVNQIKALSGSVIRFKKGQEADPNDDKAYFTIGGSKKQISRAIELIEERISKKSMFDARDGFLIWSTYRRNFKGQRPPKTTRHKCIRAGGNSVSGNPCPLCRLKVEKSKDVSYEDTDILKQFICPHSGQILPASQTGLCRQQQEKLVANIEKSWLYGLIPFTIPRPEEIAPEYKPVGIPNKQVRIRQ